MTQMIDAQMLPTLNACLNGLSTLLLTIGFIFIKRDRRQAHKRAMLSALIVSTLFLITYVTHKVIVRGVHTPFKGEEFWPMIYYPMLISHIILAMVIVPLVLRTIYLAIKGQLEKHRKWAHWTFPLWYYVSVTGVLLYFFLYVWFPY